MAIVRQGRPALDAVDDLVPDVGRHERGVDERGRPDDSGLARTTRRRDDPCPGFLADVDRLDHPTQDLREAAHRARRRRPTVVGVRAQGLEQ